MSSKRGTAKVFNAISIIAVVIIIAWFFQIDYKELSFEKNRSPYFGIASMLLMIVAMQIIAKQLKNREEKK